MPGARRWGGNKPSIVDGAVCESSELIDGNIKSGYADIALSSGRVSTTAPYVPETPANVPRKAQKSVYSGRTDTAWVPGMGPVPAKAGKPTATDVLMPGFKVERISSGQQGEVEFLPSDQSSHGEVLVRFGQDPDELSAYSWVSRRDLTVTASRSRTNERSDVKVYRETIQAMKMGQLGVSQDDIAVQLGRPLSWVTQKISLGDATKVPKPKGMEWWDAAGFCEAKYLRKYAREDGLYEEIVQGVEWDQDKVWRVRKQENADDWHLRTVKECPGRGGSSFCGRSLEKVPDTTHQIGPHDKRQAARTVPHHDWACARASFAEGTCLKPKPSDAMVEPYWWCPKCRWYACDACVKQMPDKATSKQVSQWRPGVCPRLDALISDLVSDFCLPDPMQERYTVKMNWYPDQGSRVSPHRHDNWTLLVSLGAPRVLTVDRAHVLMEDGDVILFGTQSHGVPEMPSCVGGRLSLVLMFSPDDTVGIATSLRASSGECKGRRGMHIQGLPARPSRQVERGPNDEEHNEESAWPDGISGEAANALCSMGFVPEDVIVALRAANNDVEQAGEFLFAALD